MARGWAIVIQYETPWLHGEPPRSRMSIHSSNVTLHGSRVQLYVSKLTLCISRMNHNDPGRVSRVLGWSSRAPGWACWAPGWVSTGQGEPFLSKDIFHFSREMCWMNLHFSVLTFQLQDEPFWPPCSKHHWCTVQLSGPSESQIESHLKGHENEPDFPRFLHKSVRHRSLTLHFEPFRLWLRILRDIHIRKTTPQLNDAGSQGLSVSTIRGVGDSPTQWYGESMTLCITDTQSRRLPASPIRRVGYWIF